MKKLLTVLCMVCLLLTMAGCTSAGLAQKMDAPSAIPEVPAAAPEVSPADRITPEQAQQIALDHMGITADKAERLHTKFELDDGVAQYDVEFLAGGWECEFEIDAQTGKVLSFDKDAPRD